MRSKKVYFQEIKSVKINIAIIFTIDQDPFLVLENENSLTMSFIGPSITSGVKQELVYNLLPCNSTADWLTIQQTRQNSLFLPDGIRRATFSIIFISLSGSLKSSTLPCRV